MHLPCNAALQEQEKTNSESLNYHKVALGVKKPAMGTCRMSAFHRSTTNPSDNTWALSETLQGEKINTRYMHTISIMSWSTVEDMLTNQGPPWLNEATSVGVLHEQATSLQPPCENRFSIKQSPIKFAC